MFGERERERSFSFCRVAMCKNTRSCSFALKWIGSRAAIDFSENSRISCDRASVSVEASKFFRVRKKGEIDERARACVCDGET